MNKELDAWVSRRPQLEASLKGLDNLAWRRGSAGPGGSPGKFTNSNFSSSLAKALAIKSAGWKQEKIGAKIGKNDLHGGQINDPHWETLFSSGTHSNSLVSVSDPRRDLELTRRPSRALNLDTYFSS